MINQNNNSEQSRISYALFFFSVVAAIIGMVFLKGQTFSSMDEMCPAVDKIQYVTVEVAKDGHVVNEGVTRDAEQIRAYYELTKAVKLDGNRKSYVGKEYEGTLYTVEMGHKNGVYTYSLADDGTVFHPSGKYQLENDASALCAWLEECAATNPAME